MKMITVIISRVKFIIKNGDRSTTRSIVSSTYSPTATQELTQEFVYIKLLSLHFLQYLPTNKLKLQNN